MVMAMLEESSDGVTHGDDRAKNGYMVVEASLLLRDLALQDPSEEFDGMPGEGQEPWIFLAHSAHQQIHGGSAAGLWAARICIHLGKHPFSLEKLEKNHHQK